MQQKIIEKNRIENTSSVTNYIHDGRQLYGKPMGTYFFRSNNKGNTVLVFSAGGTRVGILELIIDRNGQIEIPYCHKSFVSEAEFLQSAKTEGFECPSFPNKLFKLTFAVSEINHTVKPLKYLAGLFIASNTSLSSKIWETEELVLPEEVEDFIFDFEEQQQAARVLEKDSKFKS